MAKRRKKIKYKKERVVMADVLPYEVPITFSNRHFYNFLVDNKIEFSNGCLYWKKDDVAFDKLIQFIFNFKGGNIIEYNGKMKFCPTKQPPYKFTFLETIPFSFKISHKQKEFRELAIIHPVNQLTVVDFYNKYKELILYYCNKSSYSIRKPFNVAKYTYFKDVKHKENKAEEPERDTIEVFGKEYENLKTFFSYKEYSNIHKFYESYIYQRNEKKFNTLYKFDIAKCFDSIYTHTLSWALSNKEIIKENVLINNYTFGGAFDTLMQKLNYNETNGIIIGPEFSRIFAEILLQQIDFSVKKSLEDVKIRHKTDYAIFRYVDDYFLFFNEDTVKEKIVETIKFELIKYNLYFNEIKNSTYNKPIITDLTIAKELISDLLNSLIELKSQEIINDNKTENEGDTEKKPKMYTLYFNSKRAIIKFKIIIRETGISYKDILNYVLAVIDRKIFSLIKKYDKAVFENDEFERKFKGTFISFTLELLDFIMFIYSVSPRVNTTIKLCIILTMITKFTNQKNEKTSKIKYFTLDQKNIIFKKIFDDISLVLNINKNTEHTQVETLYLLIALQDLGRDYRLDKRTLIKYLNIKEDNGEYEFPYDFNYWSITVLLFYIKNIKRYEALKVELKKHIRTKYEIADNHNISKNTELVILTLDLLSCPYLKDNNNEFKREILGLCGIDTHQRLIIEKVEKQVNLFTKWSDFDFEKELNTKRSQEVY